MNNNLTVKGSTNFNGVLVPNIYGGFGPDQKAMTDKYIAEIHEAHDGTKGFRRDFKKHINRFIEGVDYIDLKGGADNHPSPKMLESLGYSHQEILQSKSLYLFSERGYIKVVASMKNYNNKKWEVMDAFIDGYYQMKETIQNIVSNYDRANFKRYLNNQPNEYVLCEIDKYIDYHSEKDADTRLTTYKHAIRILNDRIESLDINTIEGSLYLPLYQKKLNNLTENAWHLQVRMQAGRLAVQTTINNQLRTRIEELEYNMPLLEDNTTSEPEYQTVKMHPFSINQQYTYCANDSVKRTPQYKQWINNMRIAMNNSNLKSLKALQVDSNSPMHIDLVFRVKNINYDTDNLVKSTIDAIARYYNLENDNRFVSFSAHKYMEPVETYDEGEISFSIRNLTSNELVTYLFSDDTEDDNIITVQA